MKNFKDFIHSTGDLHDSELLSFLWSHKKCMLEIAVDDLYSNFEGLSDYKGFYRGRFVFTGVSSLTVEVDFSELGLMVYNWSVIGSDHGETEHELSFSPGGRISFKCKDIDWHEEPSENGSVLKH